MALSVLLNPRYAKFRDKNRTEGETTVTGKLEKEGEKKNTARDIQIV